MHPTSFHLKAFGQMWLPPVPARGVVRHLRDGCVRCRATLSPYLIPWMDEEPAAEAAKVHPASAGPALRGAYLTAAVRAARAAVKAVPLPPGRRVREVLARIEQDGPTALRRLPRGQLGMPAIDALLRATGTVGARNPYLRVQLAELACDLAFHLGARAAREGALRRAACRASLQAAAALRQVGALGQAEERIEQAAELYARDPRDPWIEARLYEGRGALLLYRNRSQAAAEALRQARALFRRGGWAEDLGRAFAYLGWMAGGSDEVDTALAANDHVLRLTESRPNPSIRGAAIHNSRVTLLASGRWREALTLAPPPHPSPLPSAKYACLDGILLNLAGDEAAATAAFATSYRLYSAQGRPYSAALVLLQQAASHESRGRHDAARQLVLGATGELLRLAPGREVYVALLLLRTSRRLAAARALLPLPPVIAFLREAEFDPTLRCESFYCTA
jgi:tetratricopeptide (TPR) repeat protein